MPIHILEKQPSNREAVHVGDSDDLRIDGALILGTASSALIERELDHWASVIDHGVYEGRSDLEGVGKSLHTSLVRMKMGVVSLMETLGRDLHDDFAAALLLQQRMASIIGMSRLLQEAEIIALLQGARPEADPPDEDEDDEEEKSVLLVDHNPKEYPNSGVHADNYMLGKLDIEPLQMGETQWYEGETVYIRVQTPAHVTVIMQELYRSTYNTPVPRAELTSLAGRVKRSVWNGETS